MKVPMSGNIYQAFLPVLVYSRLVGIYPQSSDRRCRLVLYLYFCLYSSLVMVCSVAAFLWLQLMKPEWYKSGIHLIIEKTQVLIVFVNYTVALGVALCQYKHFKNVLKELHYADKALGSIGVKMRYDNRIVFRVLCVRTVAQMGLFGIDLYISWKDEIRYKLFGMVSRYAPLFSVTAVQLQAFALLKFIGNHFSVMKNKMEEMQTCPNSDEVICLLKVYDVLKQTALSVNECFSLNTIFSLASIFIYVIFTLNLVATSGIIRSDFTLALYVFCISFVLLKLYELWNIIEPFVSVTNEVEMFNAALFKITMNDKLGKLAGNEKLQVHLALKQSITFTASGFFNLDYSLIQSMIGAIATFLVILIQFDINSNK